MRSISVRKKQSTWTSFHMRVNFHFVLSELYFSSVIRVHAWVMHMRENSRFVSSELYFSSVIGPCIYAMKCELSFCFERTLFFQCYWGTSSGLVYATKSELSFYSEWTLFFECLFRACIYDKEWTFVLFRVNFIFETLLYFRNFGKNWV